MAPRFTVAFGVMAGAAGSRVLVGGVFALYVASSLTSNQAAEMFQSLLLQTALVALLSASSFARASSYVAKGGDAGSLFVDFSRSVLLGSCLVILLLLGLRASTDVIVDDQLRVFLILLLGSVGAAYLGLLQGLVLQIQGSVAAFVPVIIWTLIAVIAMVPTWNSSSPIVAAAIWVVPQVLAPLSLIGSKRLRSVLTVRSYASSSSSSRGKLKNYFGLLGVVNAGGVGMAFVFRETWAGSQSPQIAAFVFLVARLAEVIYQVAYMSGAAFPRSLDRLVERVLSGVRGLLILVVISVVSFLGLGLAAYCRDRFGVQAAVVVAELAISPLRLAALGASLWLLGRSSTASFMLVAGLGSAFVGGLLFVPHLSQSLFALQVMQAVLAVVTTFGLFVAHRREHMA